MSKKKSKKKTKKEIKYPPLNKSAELYLKIKDEKHYKDIQKSVYRFGEEMERIAKLVVEDYKKNPPASGSENTVVRVHQNSPVISEKQYRGALKTLERVKMKREEYNKLNKK